MPRRQVTKPAAIDAAGLPEITEKQMAFVKGILDGKTASDAYRAAYNAENTSPESVWAMASRLRSDIKVQSWLAAARKAELGAASRTLEQHIARLDSLQQIAVENGNIGAAVAAEQSIGKVSGHYVEQYRDVTERDPFETLAQIAKKSPKLADAIAELHGMKTIEHQPREIVSQPHVSTAGEKAN